MKNAVSFLALALAFTALTAFTLSSKNNEYVGSKTCKACHSNPKTGGTAYKVWEKSVHANAYKTLKTAEADKIAKEQGHSTKAADTKECLSCHVTGHMEAGATFAKKFDKSEGVGCESCHGAASAYRIKHAKDVEGARALGLITKKVSSGAAEKQCVSCHNKKSPTYKPFKFKEAWKSVAHPNS